MPIWYFCRLLCSFQQSDNSWRKSYLSNKWHLNHVLSFFSNLMTRIKDLVSFSNIYKVERARPPIVQSSRDCQIWVTKMLSGWFKLRGFFILDIKLMISFIILIIIIIIVIIIIIIILYVSFISITMQNLEVVASKLAELWLVSSSSSSSSSSSCTFHLDLLPCKIWRL